MVRSKVEVDADGGRGSWVLADFVDQIYLYAGLAVDNKHETGFIAKEIRKHNYQTMVRLFTSLDDATFRAVLWDQSVHCLVWPPFVRYPGISETAKTDLRAYAAAGNNVVFLGNYVAVQFMNDVFGFQLTDDYQNGPYYRSCAPWNPDALTACRTRKKESIQTRGTGPSGGCPQQQIHQRHNLLRAHPFRHSGH